MYNKSVFVFTWFILSQNMLNVKYKTITLGDDCFLTKFR